MPMPSDFSVLMAFVLSVLWAAISLPLLYFNPLKFSDDEKTTRVLVYVVGPFIFFSAILLVANFMRKRSQIQLEKLRDVDWKTAELVKWAEMKLKNGPVNRYKDDAIAEFRTFIREAREAVRVGDKEKADDYMYRINKSYQRIIVEK
jgi:hypothetical protein